LFNIKINKKKLEACFSILGLCFLVEVHFLGVHIGAVCGELLKPYV